MRQTKRYDVQAENTVHRDKPGGYVPDGSTAFEARLTHARAVDPVPPSSINSHVEPFSASPRQQEFTYGGHQHLSTQQLQGAVQRLKSGMSKAIERQTADPAFASTHGRNDSKNMLGADSFNVNTLLLSGYEHEIRHRGLDPSHPSFGPDIMGMVRKA